MEQELCDPPPSKEAKLHVGRMAVVDGKNSGQVKGGIGRLKKKSMKKKKKISRTQDLFLKFETNRPLFFTSPDESKIPVLRIKYGGINEELVLWLKDKTVEFDKKGNGIVTWSYSNIMLAVLENNLNLGEKVRCAVHIRDHREDCKCREYILSQTAYSKLVKKVEQFQGSGGSSSSSVELNVGISEKNLTIDTQEVEEVGGYIEIESEDCEEAAEIGHDQADTDSTIPTTSQVPLPSSDFYKAGDKCVACWMEDGITEKY